jgi:hypothetical protein
MNVVSRVWSRAVSSTYQLLWASFLCFILLNTYAWDIFSYLCVIHAVLFTRYFTSRMEDGCKWLGILSSQLVVLNLVILLWVLFHNILGCFFGLVVRVPGYRSRGLGSILGTAGLSEKQFFWNGVHSASWVQLRSYLEEIVAAPF